MSAPSDLGSRPSRNPSTAYKTVGEDGGLVVLPDRAEVKVLNPVAVRVFGLLDGNRTVAEIVDIICNEYEVTRDQAIEDVCSFLESLRREGMLAESGLESQASEVPS